MIFYYSNIQLARKLYPWTLFSFSVLDFHRIIVLQYNKQETITEFFYPNSLFAKLLIYVILGLENTMHGHLQGLLSGFFHFICLISNICHLAYLKINLHVVGQQNSFVILQWINATQST